MEDQVITTTPATEPTIVESANTATENTAGLSQVVENPTVVEQATPMDANVTYNNLPKIEYQPTMDATQNAINMYVKTENAVNQTANAGTAMDKFLNQDYDYDKNEAGTYWVAGAINDNNTQMSFLETLINEEMYDEMDLQKYYYDTNLATARAYAAQKKKEVAYGFYRAAQERAFAEGELTGWYMPAEGRYMLGQYTVAQNTLENPDATEEEKAKATRVTTAAEKWFSANQLTTRGIKCLAMMNYEENVRHNKVMGKLQEQANKYAASQAAAGARSAEIAELNFRFQVEEEELDTGFDYSYAIGLDDEEYIGHNPKDYKEYQALRGYETTKELLKKDPVHYQQILTATSTENLKNILGDEYFDVHKNYKNDQAIASFKAEIDSTDKISDTSAGFDSTNRKTSDGYEVKYVIVGDKAVVGYFKDGLWNSITDEKATFSNGKSIKEYIENQYGKGSMDTTGINSITIDGKEYRFGRSSMAENPTSYTSLSEMNYKKAYDSYNSNNNFTEEINNIIKASESEEGYTYDGKVYKNLKYESRKMDEKNFNEYNIFSAEVEGETQYFSIAIKGKDKVKIHKVNAIDVPSVANTLVEGETITSGLDLFSGDTNKERVFKSSWIVGYDEKTNETYMFLADGSGYGGEYYAIKGKIKDGDTDDAIGHKVTSIDSEQVKNKARAAGFEIVGEEKTVSVQGDYSFNKETKAKKESTQKNFTPFSTPNVTLPGPNNSPYFKEYNPFITNVQFNKGEKVTMDDKPLVLDDIHRIEEKKKRGGFNEVDPEKEG